MALGSDDSCVEPSQDKHRGRVPLTSSLISDAVCYIFVSLLIDWIVKVVSMHNKGSRCLEGNLIIVMLSRLLYPRSVLSLAGTSTGASAAAQFVWLREG